MNIWSKPRLWQQKNHGIAQQISLFVKKNIIFAPYYTLLYRNKNMKEENKPQFTIELPENVAEGTYANMAIIAHSSSEFIIDFVRNMPNTPKAKVQSRIILNTEQAKRLLLSLQDNIAKYESTFGEITISNGPKRNIPLGFGGFKGEA
jgi:hypothetical protein